MIEHDEWCDANGCRCGKCPCLGPPACVEVDDGHSSAGTGHDHMTHAEIMAERAKES